MKNSKPIIILLWGFIGIIGALTIQIILTLFETYILGLSSFSSNTQILFEIISHYPYYIAVTVLCSPILEEFIFRKVLFGNLTNSINKLPAALISSILFSLSHTDGHFFIYASIGLLFCYIYQKTGSIYTSIFSHIGLNLVIILLANY